MSPRVEAAMRKITPEDVAREVYQVLCHFKYKTPGGLPEGVKVVHTIFQGENTTEQVPVPVVGHLVEYVAKFLNPNRFDAMILKLRSNYKFNEFKFDDGSPSNKSAMLDIRSNNGSFMTGWSKDEFLWACNTHRRAFGPERIEAAMTRLFGTKDPNSVPSLAYGTFIAAMAQEMACGARHYIATSKMEYQDSAPAFGKRAVPPRALPPPPKALPPPITTTTPTPIDPLTGQPLRRKWRDLRKPPTPPENA
jgi:hypothetical protein